MTNTTDMHEDIDAVASALIDLALASGDTEEVATITREVIATGYAPAMVTLAREVPRANTRALQDAVIASGDVESMVYFAAEVDGSDADAIARTMVDLAGSK